MDVCMCVCVCERGVCERGVCVCALCVCASCVCMGCVLDGCAWMWQVQVTNVIEHIAIVVRTTHPFCPSGMFARFDQRFGAEERIHERGFSHVRPAHEGDLRRVIWIDAFACRWFQNGADKLPGLL